MVRDDEGLLRSVALIALALLLRADAATAQEPGSVESSIQLQVFHARAIALVKLRSAGCRRLFEQFVDLDGQSLDRVLSGRDETPEARLSRIAFRDGSGTPTCDRSGVFAFTSPSSLTVFVCPAFRILAWQEGKAAANILIHEELHSLGAGEAPSPGLPTAADITSTVERFCGR